MIIHACLLLGAWVCLAKQITPQKDCGHAPYRSILTLFLLSHSLQLVKEVQDLTLEKYGYATLVVMFYLNSVVSTVLFLVSLYFMLTKPQCD